MLRRHHQVHAQQTTQPAAPQPAPARPQQLPRPYQHQQQQQQRQRQQQLDGRQHSPVVVRIAGLQRAPSAQELQYTGGLLLPGPPKPMDQPAPIPAPLLQQQQLQRRDAAAGVVARPQLKLGWAGSGIYFWWQLGAVQYLQAHFDLARVPMTGASGGGLAAVLARCGVDPDEVMESAYALSKEHRIWERPLGLVGVWGGIIEEWLHGLLPADAAARCSGDVALVVTQLPRCNQVSIDDFADNHDLVNVAMASAHVPLLLDGRATRPCRGVPCVDGSFPDFFSGVNTPLLTLDGDAVVFDYFDDANIVRNGRLDMLSLKEFREFKRIILLGYRYAQRLHEEGAFARFDVDGVAKRR